MMDMNQLMNSQEPISIRLVVVGDGSVGKTCILFSYTKDEFPVEYVPTVFDNLVSQVEVDNQLVNLSLWDTAGQESYSQLRKLSYDQADIFLVVFSVVESSSFENAIKKWNQELSKDQLSKVPKLFVGNKIDMRQDSNPNHIQTKTAKELINQMGFEYSECSALSQEGLKGSFDIAIKLALKRKAESRLRRKKEEQVLSPKRNRRCFCLCCN